MPSAVASAVYFALYVFWILLIVRLIIGYVFMFQPSFRATGIVAAVLEVTYTVTDPPLKALRRVLPPLRIGNFSLDLGFIVVIIVTRILMGQVAQYR